MHVSGSFEWRIARPRQSGGVSTDVLDKIGRFFAEAGADSKLLNVLRGGDGVRLVHPLLPDGLRICCAPCFFGNGWGTINFYEEETRAVGEPKRQYLQYVVEYREQVQIAA